MSHPSYQYCIISDGKCHSSRKVNKWHKRASIIKTKPKAPRILAWQSAVPSPCKCESMWSSEMGWEVTPINPEDEINEAPNNKSGKGETAWHSLRFAKINHECMISIKYDNTNARLISKEWSKLPCFQVVNGLFVHCKVSEVLWEILFLSCHRLSHIFKVQKLGKWSNVCLGTVPFSQKIPKS